MMCDGFRNFCCDWRSYASTSKLACLPVYTAAVFLPVYIFTHRLLLQQLFTYLLLTKKQHVTHFILFIYFEVCTLLCYSLKEVLLKFDIKNIILLIGFFFSFFFASK